MVNFLIVYLYHADRVDRYINSDINPSPAVGSSAYPKSVHIDSVPGKLTSGLNPWSSEYVPMNARHSQTFTSPVAVAMQTPPGTQIVDVLSSLTEQ